MKFHRNITHLSLCELFEKVDFDECLPNLQKLKLDNLNNLIYFVKPMSDGKSFYTVVEALNFPRIFPEYSLKF
jgi:hypothetical protein